MYILTETSDDKAEAVGVNHTPNAAKAAIATYDKIFMIFLLKETVSGIRRPNQVSMMRPFPRRWQYRSHGGRPPDQTAMIPPWSR
jgi:hypothetical protein